MPLGLRLPSGVRGDWGLESVPEDVDERSLATAGSSQPLSVSPEMERMEWCVKDKKEHDLQNLVPRPGPSFSGAGEESALPAGKNVTPPSQKPVGTEAHSRLSLSEDWPG